MPPCPYDDGSTALPATPAPLPAAAPSRPLERTPGPVRIGPLVVDPPLFLAPMAGFTNIAFRRIARRLGCGLTATEMVMAEGVVRGHERTLSIAALSPEERPGVVQIAGSDPAVMGEAAGLPVDLRA